MTIITIRTNIAPRVMGALGALLLGTSVFAMPALSQTPPGSIEETTPSPQAREPRLLTPSEVTSGSLLFQSETEGKFIAAPALNTDVVIDVSGPIIRTKVTQRFINTSDGWVEGVYVFPLPDESAVDTLRLQIGDRFIEGQIKERAQARRIYEKAKAEGRKTSLLEQERANIFTNSVANIGPGETIIVQIEYQETVDIDAGTFSTRFPMVVAPRYNPPRQVLTASIDDQTGWSIADPVPDRARITPPYNDPANDPANELANELASDPANPVTLTVNIDAGFPLAAITSSYHEMTTVKDGETRATLTLRDKVTPANRDFELSWKAANGGSPRAALFTEEINAENYYLIMITPPEEESLSQTPDREVIFVIDTSGSMSGESIRQARASLALAVDRLDADDTFNIIEFNSTTTPMFSAPRPASRANLQAAKTWIGQLDANGGTEMLPALRAAFSMDTPDDARLRQVIFLTDGSIGNEQALFETISAGRGDARIFTVGIGSAPNSYFMSRAAKIGRGTFTHIGAVNQVSERMGALFAKLETPTITDIALNWPNGTKIDLSHTQIPDMYKGETLVLAARASAETGTLALTGTSGTQPWRVNMALDQASARKGVSKLWARKRIAALELDRARNHTRDGTQSEITPETLDASILKIALDHSLISRLTSLVAVDVTPSRTKDSTLTTSDIPLNLPAGWDFEKVLGESASLSPAAIPQRKASLAPPQDTISTARVNAAPSVNLPQTATLAELKLWLGGLFLALAGLIGVLRARFLS